MGLDVAPGGVSSMQGMTVVPSAVSWSTHEGNSNIKWVDEFFSRQGPALLMGLQYSDLQCLSSNYWVWGSQTTWKRRQELRRPVWLSQLLLTFISQRPPLLTDLSPSCRSPPSPLQLAPQYDSCHIHLPSGQMWPPTSAEASPAQPKTKAVLRNSTGTQPDGTVPWAAPAVRGHCQSPSCRTKLHRREGFF